MLLFFGGMLYTTCIIQVRFIDVETAIDVMKQYA